MENLTFVTLALPAFFHRWVSIGGNTIRKVGHVTYGTLLLTIFVFYGIVSFKLHSNAKFAVRFFSRSKDIRGFSKFDK